jgi:hypothetical protein
MASTLVPGVGTSIPARQAAADKSLTKENGPDSRYQVPAGIPLENVSGTANFKGCLDECDIIHRAQEENFGTWRDPTNLARGLNAIHPRQGDIHQDHLGLQLVGLLNTFGSRGCDVDDLEFWLCFKMTLHEALPRQGIIDYKNLYNGHFDFPFERSNFGGTANSRSS